jgi:hypothetical protein
MLIVGAVMICTDIDEIAIGVMMQSELSLAVGTVYSNIFPDCSLYGKCVLAGLAFILASSSAVVIDVLFRGTTVRTDAFKCKGVIASTLYRFQVAFSDYVFKRDLLDKLISEYRRLVYLEVCIRNLNIFILAGFKLG